jgi:hypothetical protein
VERKYGKRVRKAAKIASRPMAEILIGTRIRSMIRRGETSGVISAGWLWANVTRERYPWNGISLGRLCAKFDAIMWTGVDGIHVTLSTEAPNAK